MPPALLDGLLDDATLLTLLPPASPTAESTGRIGAAGPSPDDGPADDGLTDDGLLTARVAAAAEAHRVLVDDPATELLAGPLLVPTSLAEAVLRALRPNDHAVRLILVPDRGPGGETGLPDVAEQLHRLRVARNLFLDDDRTELVGVQVPLPSDAPAAGTVRAVVDALDFTVPAWLQLRPGPGWLDALAVLAEDGAEGVAAAGAGPDALPDDALAALLRAVVDRELTVRIVGGPLPVLRPAPGQVPGGHVTGRQVPGGHVTGGGPHGLLNVLCAVRAALNGAEPADLAGILAATDPAPLLSALRRMSDADAMVVRAFLAAVPTSPVAATVADLTGLGLLPTEP